MIERGYDVSKVRCIRACMFQVDAECGQKTDNINPTVTEMNVCPSEYPIFASGERLHVPPR